MNRATTHGHGVVRADAAEGRLLVPILDGWLRPDTAWSLRDEYPQVFGPRSAAKHYLIEDVQGLAAHAAVLDVELRMPGRSFDVRLVGSVVVRPERRGSGLGQRLVEAVVADWRHSTARLCLLWSDKPGLYVRAGFSPVGSELLALIDAGPLPTGLRRAVATDGIALARLHAAKPIHVIRTAEDWCERLAIPDLQVFVLEEQGRVTAYACVGKGLDFPDVLHESGGSDDALRRLLPAVAAMHGGGMPAILPPWRRDLVSDLGPFRDSALGLGLAADALPESTYVEGLDSI